jgi:hypothetical protein
MIQTTSLRASFKKICGALKETFFLKKGQEDFRGRRAASALVV